MTTIDTLTSWNGLASVGTYGYPDTATYGQAFKTPNGSDVILNSFLIVPKIPATCTFGTYVYEWDVTNRVVVGSSLYASGARNTTANVFEQHTFTIGVTLDSTKTYIFLISVSEFSGSGTGRFGLNNASNPYTDGKMYFLNNGTDETQWALTSWVDGIAGNILADLAFQAVFSSTPAIPAITAASSSPYFVRQIRISSY